MGDTGIPCIPWDFHGNWNGNVDGNGNGIAAIGNKLEWELNLVRGMGRGGDETEAVAMGCNGKHNTILASRCCTLLYPRSWVCFSSPRRTETALIVSSAADYCVSYQTSVSAGGAETYAGHVPMLPLTVSRFEYIDRTETKALLHAYSYETFWYHHRRHRVYGHHTIAILWV